MSIDVHWCPLMSIDVHWCPLMSIGIPFVWLFCLWSPTSSKGGRTNGFPVKSSTPFSKGILCASWYKRPGKTKKAKLQNGQNDIGQITLSQLSAVNRSQLVSTSDSTVSIFRRTDTVQGLRRSTAFEPTGLKLHVKGALDTFLQERPASFHDSMWDIWEWYAKKASLISWFISCWGSFCLFLFPYDFIEFPREILQNVPQVRPGRSLRRAFFSASPVPHRAVQPRLRWIPHLISLGESYEKFIRTWENMWNCMKMS